MKSKNTTLGTVPKYNRKIPHSEQFRNIIEKYHTRNSSEI